LITDQEVSMADYRLTHVSGAVFLIRLDAIHKMEHHP
jgi:hypothetical protein